MEHAYRRFSFSSRMQGAGTPHSSVGPGLAMFHRHALFAAPAGTDADSSLELLHSGSLDEVGEQGAKGFDAIFKQQCEEELA